MVDRVDGVGVGVGVDVGVGVGVVARTGELGADTPTRLGEVGAGGTTSTSELRSEVEYLGLCFPRMWSLSVSLRE